MSRFSWVAADAVYGVSDVEQALRRACKGYVLGVKSDHHFRLLGRSLRLLEQPERSHTASNQMHGSVFPLVREPRARGFMTRPIAS